MRVIPFVISAVATTTLVVVLNSEWNFGGKPVPPLGSFLSPQHGFWQNADPVDKDYNADIHLPQLKGKATVYLDDRLVPHIFADNEADAYFVEGYLHAKFRLWQMEFQVYYASGRISELIGPLGLNTDREKRRLGMVYAAERALERMERDSVTKSECDAYTAGFNTYLDQMKESELPVEYKLLHYKPEKWTNLKTALFLKYMSYDLAGNEKDFEYTNARTLFGWDDFQKMYPISQDSLDPIVPKGTVYPSPSISLKIPPDADSVYFGKKDSVNIVPRRPDKDNGSNNWAVSGKKTVSGAPILCNDPHLSLNLPSLWFEVQISCPGLNVYGASFPGAPGVVIGFNDSCAFGFTNAMRDVRDYYTIRFRDESMKEYWFDGQWRPTDFRFEHIGVKGQDEFIDTVAYTVFGPVMYDRKFNGNGRTPRGEYFAVRWKAHDPSNELIIFNRLNHAKNYEDYFEAIKWLHTPGQNCVFASKAGDIAIWSQGEFPAKWKRQGDFIMPGTDSSYMWQGIIPQDENPHLINPERGFVSSANQLPADPAAYPYYLGGEYPPYRGIMINRLLSQKNQFTIDDMMKIQTENYNVFAEMARPVLLRNIDLRALSEDERNYFELLQTWNLRNDPDEKGPTLFVLTWDNFTKVVWDDEFASAKLPLEYPTESTLLESILRDSTFKFLDNIRTPARETLKDDITIAFKRAVKECKLADAEGRLSWGRYKATGVNHLARLAPFSRSDLPIGGGLNCINAAKSDHGPSWRMIVQLTAKTVAYGIYPGGQSGNPGSVFYDNFIDSWAAGKYFELWMMNSDETSDKRIKWKMDFSGFPAN